MKGYIVQYGICSKQDYNEITDWQNKQSQLLCDIRYDNTLVLTSDFLIYQFP
ncbi:hypothetical protein NIES4103_67540 [Nostoc sp. NIES-4103]|nr:hypothetical protein NIES4103_67540 [Nostoc sp. NIES-4103]